VIGRYVIHTLFAALVALSWANRPHAAVEVPSAGAGMPIPAGLASWYSEEWPPKSCARYCFVWADAAHRAGWYLQYEGGGGLAQREQYSAILASRAIPGCDECKPNQGQIEISLEGGELEVLYSGHVEEMRHRVAFILFGLGVFLYFIFTSSTLGPED
jgi:hypothetical protein